ncbi:MAG: NADH dehydrogenase subunit [Lentimicrobium sp.]|nr:NADH dehydrogenase subunit [Lentimicrobium sp.]
MKKSIEIKNNQTISIASIPELDYADFLGFNTAMMADEACHCVQYFAVSRPGAFQLICCMANDREHNISVSSSLVKPGAKLASFTRRHFSFHFFEREIHENYGLQYTDHPWLKPIRFPFDRADMKQQIANYPFYHMDSEELHEVGVGPIHAGVIEPGHFRFICNGEQILHLEIQLGFQHRGVEYLMLQKKNLLQQTILAESISGDTVVGHTTAFASIWENLAGFKPSPDLVYARTVALEWERIAIHSGDLSAIATDIAYQLGSSVFGRLRTPIINAFQEWCGNRLAKSLIRPGRNRFPFTPATEAVFTGVLDAYWPDYTEMFDRMIDLPSVLARLEKTGVVSREQSLSIGAVGLSARGSGVERDVRKSHPYLGYEALSHQPLILPQGDVDARTRLRDLEIRQSIGYVREMMKNTPPVIQPLLLNETLASDSFSMTMIEGWRGEICHCALTGAEGELIAYKIKDPSVHNWLALALSVRNNEISDFPICNKSFNLSYCGHDL